jgi:hypothetical protein
MILLHLDRGGLGLLHHHHPLKRRGVGGAVDCYTCNTLLHLVV